MIGVQYDQLAFHTDIHVLGSNGLQIIRHIELDANTLQAVTENLPNRIEVTGKLIQVCASNVASISIHTYQVSKSVMRNC